MNSSALLVSFADAGVLLGVDAGKVRQLIHDGHLTPHPILANRIPRAQIEDFALHYGDDAKADTEKGREVDDSPTKEEWGVPQARLRQVTR